jgi:hypothetical protein
MMNFFRSGHDVDQALAKGGIAGGTERYCFAKNGRYGANTTGDPKNPCEP